MEVAATGHPCLRLSVLVNKPFTLPLPLVFEGPTARSEATLAPEAPYRLQCGTTIASDLNRRPNSRSDSSFPRPPNSSNGPRQRTTEWSHQAHRHPRPHNHDFCVVGMVLYIRAAGGAGASSYVDPVLPISLPFNPKRPTFSLPLTLLPPTLPSRESGLSSSSKE